MGTLRALTRGGILRLIVLGNECVRSKAKAGRSRYYCFFPLGQDVEFWNDLA